MKKVITIKKSKVQTLIFDKEYPKNVDVKYILTKKGAALDLCVKVLGRGKQSIDMNFEVVHRAVDTKSRITVRSALYDSFQARIFGNVKIEQHAKNSNARLEMKTLLLSDNTHAVTKPFMEISADDVQASHGASIGHMNKNQLFYLQSRGLSQKEAEKILLTEFFL